MTDLKVLKKDGSMEDFQIDKIIDSLEAAGLSEKLAKKVAEKVTRELHKIDSSYIRELVLKYLKKEDPELAKKMIQYDINKKKEKPEMSEEFIV